jgi:His-Xaa-Ser system protein HxsD
MTTILKLDHASYSVEAVQKAAYNLIDRVVVIVSVVGDAISCEIEPVLGSNADFDASLQDFKRELIDQELRMKIKSETEAVRNLVLAYTFSRTGLQG